MPDAIVRRIEETVVDGMRLGRHIVHDLASVGYPADRASSIKSVTHAATGLPLDQDKPKPWGSCTANALCGALNSAPDSTRRTKPLTEADAFALYQAETALEGYHTPPDDPGGSGLMVCKAAKQQGLVRSYRHAFGLEHTLLAATLRPVIIGIDWYTSFDQPSADGVIALPPGATVRGGHEVLIDEVDVERSLVGLWNSWGTGWGLGGRFYMPFDLLGRLLSSGGDATVPLPA